MNYLLVAGRKVASVSLLSLILAGPLTATAATGDISAVFRPDPAKPSENEFINTTPPSGFCRSWPTRCAALGIFSLALPITFQSTKAIEANHSDSRQGAMLKVPGDWRALQVTHSGTGESHEVSVRISAIGATYRLTPGAQELVGGGVSVRQAHMMLWAGGVWNRAPSPCSEGSTEEFYYGGNAFEFFWRTPLQDAACTKQAKYLIPAFLYHEMSYGYQLRTPNPLKMSSGHYTGTLTYTVGPGQDFDMGDVMLPDDSILTLNFNLEVQHTLKVEVPPGGNRVELVPQEGWQSWLNSGRKPTRLFRDQRFHISASSRFKMGLECQYVSGNTCAISETSSGHQVPVNVSVTLPQGLTDGANQPVDRRPLLLDGSGTELFQPSFYLDRKSGMLHFEVDRSSVEDMLDSGAKAYTGNVTVIWDSEV
ncbi:hypothetical protein [Pseudomonas frederiksbergensis]|jgi:hypothetical protein|uniref:Fimbrial protein n=1 Tax=Pseudomonas frederiksbergensis TaxID=104087 RepID=A0A0B1Z4X5_9PSED|nr:hypothetical protein [Pseudomonas frederiksbergensis]KHK64428.1 hypothetical protein JZ00_11725 [Pseudomonas frederiksbergensis]WRV69503.1 hypothetical protein VQ575_05460 [Pseudomonas frederiksbergensis]